MKRVICLLIGIILLYIAPSLVLKAMYGPSYVFPPSEDCWTSDGSGGWVAHGKPDAPMPNVPSETVPTPFLYLPIFLPAILLATFMFGPWSKKIQANAPSKADPAQGDSEALDDSDKPTS